MESFAVARNHIYGMLAAARADGIYVLPPANADTSTQVAAMQLSKAGTRLALLLNRMLASAGAAGR